MVRWGGKEILVIFLAHTVTGTSGNPGAEHWGTITHLDHIILIDLVNLIFWTWVNFEIVLEKGRDLELKV